MEKPRSNSKLHWNCGNLRGGFADVIPQRDKIESVIQAECVQRFAKQPRILGAVEKLLRARTMIAKVDIWQLTLK